MSSLTPQPRLLHQLRASLRKGWLRVFAQKRTRELAIELAITFVVMQAKQATISAAIEFNGQQDDPWNPYYRLFSDSPWSLRELFRPCLALGLAKLDPESIWIPAAIDDTGFNKSGKKIPDASYQRDPLSPHFHPNIRLRLRYLQVSLLLPLYNKADTGARGIPIRFEPAPVLKKPGKRADAEQWKQYKELKKTHNLPVMAGKLVGQIRQDLDREDATQRQLLALVDGSLCNTNMFRAIEQIKRTHLLGRCRKDASLCQRAPAGSCKIYGTKFTPQQIYSDENMAWQSVSIFYGGQWRQIQFKRIDSILWQRGARRRQLTLFVLKATPYKTSKNAKINYREAAYLLTTATEIDSHQAIQMYFDRWQIEVNHREEKHDLGVGQAQLWAPESVKRQPGFVVCAYSMMQLAALECYGPTRTQDYLPLARWRKDPQRASCRDMSRLLKKQLLEQRLQDQLDGLHPVAGRPGRTPARFAHPTAMVPQIAQA